MARIDKAHIVVRAPAGTALTGTRAVKLNSGGSIIYSGSNDAVGVICIPGTIEAGRAASFLRAGEIVEYGGGAGSLIYALASGSIGTTSGGTQLGFTVEGDRFVVAM